MAKMRPDESPAFAFLEKGGRQAVEFAGSCRAWRCRFTGLALPDSARAVVSAEEFQTTRHVRQLRRPPDS
jgi:hypothetical protein